MSRQIPPQAAFVEEYDEDAHVSLPETRQIANAISKRSKPDLRKSAREPFVEAASDSGYSSRTAATVNSAQSAPSGPRPPVPLKVDTSAKRTDLERVRSRTKERPSRDRSARQPQEDKMHAGPYSAGYPPAHLHRSSSRPQRLERTYTQNVPRNYWDPERGVYHANPVEPKQREYRYHSSQGSSYDYPSPSPHTSRYPPAVVQVSHSSRPGARNNRSNSYHSNSRPVSFHAGMMPNMNGMMYGQSPMGRYDHGPPLSSSAYSNSPVYPPGHPSLYSQQSPYYPYPDATSPPEHHDRSLPRPREQHRARRPSVFEPPPEDFETSEEEEEEEEEDDLDEDFMEPTPPPPPPGPSRQARPRRPSRSHDRGEDDYYRSMPPPPMKQRAPPAIIQKRPELPHKSATTASIMSERRASRSLDMNEFHDALPSEYGYHGSSGGTVIPERNRSLRESRRPSVAYHDSRSNPRRIAVENSSSRRRRPTLYDYPPGDELEEKQRDVEQYQASQSSKAPVPVSISDALLKAKANSQAGSDSGSQKSRSASSRGSGSDARTRSGSGALTTTRPEDDENITMTLNGVTMSFTQESVGGKRINVRSGHSGALEFNIEGKRPKKYITGGSEYTTTSSNSRKGDRKSERASRRSSRSTHNGRF